MNSDRQTERKITPYRSKALKAMASARLPSSEFCQKLNYTLPNLINRAFMGIATKHPRCYCSSTQRQQRAATRELPRAGGEGWVIPFPSEVQDTQSIDPRAEPARALSRVLNRRRFTLRGGSAWREAVAESGSGGTLAPGEESCPQPLVAF